MFYDFHVFCMKFGLFNIKYMLFPYKNRQPENRLPEIALCILYLFRSNTGYGSKKSFHIYIISRIPSLCRPCYLVSYYLPVISIIKTHTCRAKN